MKRGRPFERGNWTRASQRKPEQEKAFNQKILDENAPTIMALAINTARDDDKMLRVLIRELGRRMGDRPVKLGRLPMNTLTDLEKASATILAKVTAGKISISEGVAVCGMIELRRQVLAGVELETRVAKLEGSYGLEGA